LFRFYKVGYLRPDLRKIFVEVVNQILKTSCELDKVEVVQFGLKEPTPKPLIRRLRKKVKDDESL
jgi:hypothetical protein